MQRVANSFSLLALLVLAFGVAAPRIIPDSGMTFTWDKVGYLIPYGAICFGMGFMLSLFAFLYSAVWMVPWKIGAGWWHLDLSVAVVTAFITCLVAHRLLHDRLQRSIPVLATLILAPVVFTFLQFAFGLDALRRCLMLASRH